MDLLAYMVKNGTLNYVHSHCEANLKKLDVEYNDLYYQHRINTSLPIQDAMILVIQNLLNDYQQENLPQYLCPKTPMIKGITKILIR